MNEVAQRRIDVSQPSSRHQVIYLLITKGGGMDGTDRTDKGGKIIEVHGFEEVALKSPSMPWCTIEPRAVDLKEIARQASDKLDPLERYAITRKGIQE